MPPKLEALAVFKNIIRQIPISEILIDRENRQRRELTFDSVLSLAISIGRSQWISPILIDESTNYLIAGERRLTAVKALHGAVNGDYSGFTNPEEARIALCMVCTCHVDSWEQWSKIPAQIGKDLTPLDIAMYEFIENAQRQDLPWQDKAKAIYDIHTRGVSQNKDWTAVDTAGLVGVGPATVTENLRVWRVHEDEGSSQELKTIITESSTLRAATQTIERFVSRREPGLGVSLSSGVTTPRKLADKPVYIKPGPAPLVNVNSKSIESVFDDDEVEPTPTLSNNLINTDFTTWAPQYVGEPFNFVHCDFPYGISFNTGGYTGTVENKMRGEYEDTEDTYWSLLNTLRDNRHLIATQAHIMFWFSQNLRRQTEDFFTSMGGIVQPFLMVWHCTESQGIVPDPQRYGRRTYETAMLVTFGDRKIVVPRNLSVSVSRESATRIHRSQKPIQVLEHFFGMFVDGSSIVLDPTAGSGTSLIAANKFNAKNIIGIEKDIDIYKKACEYINSATVIRP